MSRQKDKSVTQLLTIASPTLLAAVSVEEAMKVPPGVEIDHAIYRELIDLLGRKNGFYAFESALHVLPFSRALDPMGLLAWNSNDLWRSNYGNLAQGLLFFAEDAFGGQFALKNRGVYLFNPETADTEFMGECLDEWAEKILNDYNYHTGYSLAHEWQSLHGPLKPGSRLLPKMPFVVGGEFHVNNLRVTDAVEGMKRRAVIAKKIHDLPDGAKVKVRFR